MNSLPSIKAAAREKIVKIMTDRFLQWKLPDDFNPDGGITFKKIANEGTNYPHTYNPVGTNLFSSTQAEAMIEYLLGTTIDSLIDLTYQSIKESVVPEEEKPDKTVKEHLYNKKDENCLVCWEQSGIINGHNSCRREILRRFKEMEGKEHPANCVACSNHGPHGPQEKA